MALDCETETTDAELLARYAAGEQAAARALTFRHAPRLIALARRMLNDAAEAEDVAQETLLRLWKIAPDWRDEARLSTWLHRVASNLCLDRLRRRRGQGLDDLPEIADGAASAQDGLEGRDRLGALNAALDSLPERQRVAVVLRHIEEQSNIEIARTLGLSVEAVESLLARGRRALASRLLPRRRDLGFADD